MEGIKNSPVSFIFTLLNMIILNPGAFFKILNMFLKKRKQKKSIIGDSHGQWLTFGVLPDALRVINDKGHRISYLLVEMMKLWFRKRDFKRISAGVRKNN